MLTTNEVAIARAKVCNGCDRLFKPTWTCKECGCFMKVKVRVSAAECPRGLWKKQD